MREVDEREREREREREKGGDCEFLNETNQEFEKDFRERDREKEILKVERQDPNISNTEQLF